MISIIAIMGKDREIGVAGQQPWQIPADLTRFRELTTGHTVIMGRRTYEIIGRPLPGRRNIVLSRDHNFQAEGCEIRHSFDEALTDCADGEVFVIGGGEIYKQALPIADRLYLTIVDDTPDADTFFPEYTGFQETFSEQHEYNGLKYRFVELEK